MGVVKGAVACAVAALLAGRALSGMEPERRAALWALARTVVGAAPPFPATAVAVMPAPRAAPTPAAPSFGEERVAPDAGGQFETTVEIEGHRLPALVDTGATYVSLSAEDAARLGIHPAPADFRYGVSTANGTAAVAMVRLRAVRLGSIEVRDVPALVSGPGQLGQSLLGMSFLSRLSGVRVDRGTLLLSR